MTTKKIVLVVLVVLVVVIYLVGRKGRQSPGQMREPMTMEELTALTMQTATAPESKSQVVQAPTTTPPGAKLEPLPPPGPYKPTPGEIQTALKNVGLYTDVIDGKIGPKTKKAIEEFQRTNGLKVDGRVGPKTWAVLSKYLNPKTPPIEKRQ